MLNTMDVFYKKFNVQCSKFYLDNNIEPETTMKYAPSSHFTWQAWNMEQS